MKVKMTTIAAAIALSTSFAVNAAPVTDPNNLDYVGAQASPPSYGVDNNTTFLDDGAWPSPLPMPMPFNATGGGTFSSELSSMPGSSAALGDNDSVIDQTTASGLPQSGNAASVMQGNGTQNDSYIRQNKLSSGDTMEVEVEQSGNNNHSDVVQDLNYGATSKVYQTGDGHRSRVTQLGDHSNKAEVQQNGSAQRSIIEQGTKPGGADSNTASVFQSNMNNESFVRQQWDSNDATVIQFGNNGTSKVWQQSDNNIAFLSQGGSDNSSSIRQGVTGSSDNNFAFVVQDGSDNNSGIQQEGGDANIAGTLQIGNDGQSSIFQNGAGNIAGVAQFGVGDVSMVIQEGDSKTALVLQTGVGIAGVEFNESYILQKGTGAHTALVVQDHAPASGWNNVSTITQLNSANGNATVFQSGAGNRASTIQY